MWPSALFKSDSSIRCGCYFSLLLNDADDAGRSASDCGSCFRRSGCFARRSLFSMLRHELVIVGLGAMLTLRQKIVNERRRATDLNQRADILSLFLNSKNANEMVMK
jgi:hypothetical protein